MDNNLGMGNMKKSNYLYKCLFLQLIIMFFANTATAEVLGLAGVSHSDQSTYAYIGAIIPINSNLGEQGFRIKLWGNYQDYDYDGKLVGGPTGTTTSFNGDGFGGDLSLGYQWNFQNTTVTAYAGVALRDINISPDDPASDTEDDNVGARFQLELNPQFSSNVDASLIGTYTVGFDSYWVRGRPGYTFTNGLKFGPELVVMGGDDYDKQRFGAFLSGFNFGSVNVGINGGYEDGDDDDGAYGGISLSTVF